MSEKKYKSWPMTRDQSFIAAAVFLSFFVLWFLWAAVGDKFICWIGGKDNLSGWVQAFGSILAVMVAIYIPYKNNKNNQEDIKRKILINRYIYFKKELSHLDVSNENFRKVDNGIKHLLKFIPNVERYKNIEPSRIFRENRKKFVNDVVSFIFSNEFIVNSHDLDSLIFRDILDFNRLMRKFMNDLLVIDFNDSEGPNQFRLKSLVSDWETIVEKRKNIYDRLIKFESYVENDFR